MILPRLLLVLMLVLSGLGVVSEPVNADSVFVPAASNIQMPAVTPRIVVPRLVHGDAPGYVPPNPTPLGPTSPQSTTTTIVGDLLDPAPQPGQGTTSNSPVDFFEGPSAGNTPDPGVAAGSYEVVTVVNSKLVVLNKGSNRNPETHVFSDFVLPGYERTTDPRVAYDRLSRRWFIVFLAIRDASPRDAKLYLLVSLTSNPRNPPAGSGWCVYPFQPDGITTATFPDFPTLGINNEGVYIGSHITGHDDHISRRTSVLAIPKVPLLSCSSVASWDKGDVRDIDGNITGTIQPAVELDTFGWQVFVSAPLGSGTRMTFYRLASPNATLEKQGLDIDDYSAAVDTPQYGVGSPPITHMVSGWLTGGATYFTGRLTTAHTVRSRFNPANAAVRAYDINVTSAAVASIGVQTEFSTASRGYFNASYSLNQVVNHSAITFSYSSASDYPGMMYAQKVVSGPGFRAPRTLVGGTGPVLTRFGDYAGSAADPDGDAIWVINEYGKAGTEGATFVAEAAATA